MVVGAKVCDLTEDLLCFVCGLYVGILTSSLIVRGDNFVPPTTNLSQKFTELSKGISYPAGEISRRFTKLTGLFVYTLHSNQTPLKDGTNVFC